MKPKPQLDPERFQAEVSAGRGEAILDELQINVEGWGEEGWLRVGRICRWAAARGAELPFQCPPSTAAPLPDT